MKDHPKGLLPIWAQREMRRIFADTPAPKKPSRRIQLNCARNEYACFQVGLRKRPDYGRLEFEASDLVGSAGRIPSRCVKVFCQFDVPVMVTLDPKAELERVPPALFPDPLIDPAPERIWKGQARSLWVRLYVPPETRPGRYRGALSIRGQTHAGRIDIDLAVRSFALPRDTEFLMSNWIYLPPYARLYGVPLDSPALWRLIRTIAADLAAHRQNVVRTPLASVRSPSDRAVFQLTRILRKKGGVWQFEFSRLDRWIRIFNRHGIRVFEFSCIADKGRRSPGMRRFRFLPLLVEDASRGRPSLLPAMPIGSRAAREVYGALLEALTRHLERRWPRLRFLLHLADEPNRAATPKYVELARWVKSKTTIPIAEAISPGSDEDLPLECIAAIDVPIAWEPEYEWLVKEHRLDPARAWFYYCNGPRGLWPNRFVDYSPIRVRIFTWCAFRYGIPGFVHWGYNYWASIRSPHLPYNPYDNGLAMSPGDGYVVYPSLNPLHDRRIFPSIRWEIIRAAMQDHAYLTLLRRLTESARKRRCKPAWVAAADRLFREIEARVVPDFEHHTRDPEYLMDVRDRVGDLIEKLM